jgi:hypothetical protein
MPAATLNASHGRRDGRQSPLWSMKHLHKRCPPRPYFACDDLADVIGPPFGGIEGENAIGVFVLPGHQIGKHETTGLLTGLGLLAIPGIGPVVAAGCLPPPLLAPLPAPPRAASWAASPKWTFPRKTPTSTPKAFAAAVRWCRRGSPTRWHRSKRPCSTVRQSTSRTAARPTARRAGASTRCEAPRRGRGPQGTPDIRRSDLPQTNGPLRRAVFD